MPRPYGRIVRVTALRRLPKPSAGSFGIALLLLGALFSVAVASLSIAARTVEAQQEPVAVLAGLNRTHGTVGDPVVLTVTVRYAPGVQVNTDGLESQFAPFEVLSAEPPVDQRAPDGTNERRLRFTIAAYQAGSFQLPALTVPYTFNGQSAQAQGQPLSFMVDSVIPRGDKATDIRPLKPQLDLPLPAAAGLRWLIAAGVAALVLVAMGLLAWRLRRRAPSPALAEIPSLAPLEAEARAELDAIVADELLARGDYRTHYARMAECIRRYLSRRYGFPASALTTAELNERMVRSGVGRWRARLVTGLLAECDAVHYAHYLPAPARAEADLQMAYEIVDLALSQETRAEDTRLEVGL